MKKFIVLGGGFAGVEAAIRLRKYGYKVTLVSDRDYLFVYPISIWVPTKKLSFEDAQINLTAVYFNLGDIDNAYKTLKTINFASLDPRYDKSIELVLRRMMRSIIIDEEDSDMKSSLERIYNDNEWIKKVFGQSLEKKIDYGYQVCEEAIYLMEIMDKSISSQRAIILREKYSN